MLDGLYQTLGGPSSVPVVIISVAIILLVGFAITRITKKLKLPNVTAYILAGILIGPYCLNLIPQTVIEGSGFLSDIAVAFISFSVGEFFRFSSLKKSGGRVLLITFAEALPVSVLTFVVCYFLLRLPLSLSIVLAAVATATSSTSTLMTIRQTKAHGEFVDTLLQVVAIDNVVSLLMYSVAISIAIATLPGATVGFEEIGLPLIKMLATLVVGFGLGFVLKWLLPTKRSKDNRLIILLCILFVFCGICSALEVSPLLGCMIIGTVYYNVSDDNKLFSQVNYFSPPFMLVFFVRSGLNLELGALFAPAAGVGFLPLWVVVLVYFVVRSLGKYFGAFAGCTMAKTNKDVRNSMGLALLPQASVAIGLASLAERSLANAGQPELGSAALAIVVAGAVLFEIVGPVLAKLSLHLSHSYSDRIEDVAPVVSVSEDGKPKTEVELLIERIQKIQTEIAPHEEINEEELAFTEAAEEYENLVYPAKRGFVNRK